MLGGVLFLLCLVELGNCGLRPQCSETRETKTLNGIWRFRVSPSLDPGEGFRSLWYQTEWISRESIPMPVPSSYNDITQNKTIRDHVGWVWYQRTFYTSWGNQNSRSTFIRFDSVHYSAIVWINGMKVVEHFGGHLPFEADVSKVLMPYSVNVVTVAVNNTLTDTSLPQGTWNWPENKCNEYPPGYFTMNYNFDFLNYAGIHRSVTLYSTPKERITDITVKSIKITSDLEEARIYFTVEQSIQTKSKCVAHLIDPDTGNPVSQSSCRNVGVLTVKKPTLWWPNGYNPKDEPVGFLYVLKVKTKTDVYRLKVGIRSVEWNDDRLLINHRPFYFKGFGKHEDSDIRGKGLDLPIVIKDFNLIRWMGANSFRTSHYPYAEEILDAADEYGIVVILESPGVALSGFSDGLLATHLRITEEMIDRDKNRACVVTWSVANEPASSEKAAKDYFLAVVNTTRRLDPTRPVMIVLNADVDTDLGSISVDIIGLNKYFGWYSDTGHTELIQRQMENHIRRWKAKRNKPIVVTEYGADTISGFHQDPSFIFTEEFQSELMIENFKAFDSARRKNQLIGEMIWNFADFMTKQGLQRVLGNRKGIFTRQRQPKMSAHLLRSRYLEMTTTHFFTDEIEDDRIVVLRA